MTPSEQVKMLREMAEPLAGRALEYDLRSIVSDNAGHIDLARLEKSLGESAASKAAALNAGAEALEAMSAKQTSAAAPTAQKAEILSGLADAADALARLDCGLTDRAGMAQRAALFRECAAMMRERETVQWDAEGGGTKDGLHLFAGPVLSGFTSLVTKQGQTLYMDWRPTLEAARAAAVAWADGREGNRDMEEKNGKS